VKEENRRVEQVLHGVGSSVRLGAGSGERGYGGEYGVKTVYTCTFCICENDTC
jgi:hypothetical protein